MIARLTLFLALLLAAPAAAEQPDRWETGPPAPVPRQEAALATLDGKLYFAGGLEEGGIETARQDVYDIATGTWSVAPPMPESAHHLAAVGLKGKVYYLGGLQTLMFAPTGRMWAYDPATRTWSLKASLPAGRERGAGAVAVYQGRIIYVGGQRIVAQDGPPRRVAVGYVDAYNPRTDSWSPLPDMPTARDHFGVGIVGDTLYAVGGRALRLNLPVVDTEALDLETHQWRTELAEIPTSRGGFATAVVGREIVTIGGESPKGALSPEVHVHDEVEAYDPLRDEWRALARMPLPRYGIQGAVHGRGIWVAGGGIGGTVLTTESLDVLYPAPGPGPLH